MPSVLDLIEKKSKEIYSLAQEEDVSGRGDMTTVELIAELSEENLPKKAQWAANPSTKKSELVDFADEMGINSEGKKLEIQQRLLEDLLSKNRSSSDVPIGERTHFDDMDVRKEAIMNAAQKAAQRTISKGYPYVVIESFRDKDYNDPLRISAKYSGHDFDEIIVFETGVCTRHLPNTNVDKNPPRA